MNLEAWNHDTFGNIFKRKRCNVLRLLGVQRALERNVIEGLLNLDLKMRLERREILHPEELLWKQESRNEWLKAGDGNTRFFHTSTIVRRRRNIIESLKNEQGV